jgi:hypothetical protein
MRRTAEEFQSTFDAAECARYAIEAKVTTPEYQE